MNYTESNVTHVDLTTEYNPEPPRPPSKSAIAFHQGTLSERLTEEKNSLVRLANLRATINRYRKVPAIREADLLYSDLVRWEGLLTPRMTVRHPFKGLPDDQSIDYWTLYITTLCDAVIAGTSTQTTIT